MTSAGQRHEQGRYRTPAGERGVYAQRIDGRVCVTDVPIGHDAEVLLVERHVESTAELDALVRDYVEQSTMAGAPAVRAPGATARMLAALAG